MIYIDECIDATIQYLKADKKNLKRNAYNLAGVAFTPEQLAVEITKLIPGFTIDYKPCPNRSPIAGSWPRSIDDSCAQNDWDWKYNPTLYELAHKILTKIDGSYKEGRKLNM